MKNKTYKEQWKNNVFSPDRRNKKKSGKINFHVNVLLLFIVFPSSETVFMKSVCASVNVVFG